MKTYEQSQVRPIVPPAWAGLEALESRTLLSAAAMQSVFDEAFYLASYPDVKAAVNAGLLPSGFQHYANYGQYEGRQPSPYFDRVFYLRTYTDVQPLINAHTYTSAFDHFATYGQTHGYRPDPFFDEAFYKTHYGDVGSAVTAVPPSGHGTPAVPGRPAAASACKGHLRCHGCPRRLASRLPPHPVRARHDSS